MGCSQAADVTAGIELKRKKVPESSADELPFDALVFPAHAGPEGLPSHPSDSSVRGGERGSSQMSLQ